MVRDANTSPFTAIGHIVRSHGLHGELKVQINPEFINNFESVSLVYLQNDRGDFYPRRINEIRTEGKGNSISFFAHFDSVADRNSADLLKNRSLYVENRVAEQIFEDPDADNESLLDFEVINDSGESLGLVIDVMDQGVQTLITVATTKGSLLIPVVDEYISDIDDQNQRIFCHNLEQLEGL
ncbi:MAG TPA: 16S rRNA processing protein RimM [Balneolaceae bacterium]|nr:16S rRNA processing protein RimM [Balneolaceae bacterium]|tara:strand:+ start:60489 stop:61034 length:546 start_codon:yes stop_codon:yes gene_type:complete